MNTERGPSPWVAIVVAVISAIASIGAAFITANNTAKVKQVDGVANQALSATTQNANEVRTLAGSTVGSLEKGQKLCRVLQGKTWRDGVIVPQNWTVMLCTDYMKKTGGNGYQLGCIYADEGTTLGKEDGSLPTPNCGWK